MADETKQISGRQKAIIQAARKLAKEQGRDWKTLEQDERRELRVIARETLRANTTSR